MSKYDSEIKLPDEYFRMVGIIAAQWEYIEFQLEWAVAEIGGHKVSKVGLLTTNLGYQAKHDLILAHGRPLKAQSPDEWSALTTVMNDVQKAYLLRNTFVHAKWIAGESDAELPKRSIVRTRGGKLIMDDFPTELSELVEAATKIQAAGDGFLRLMQTYDIMSGDPDAV